MWKRALSATVVVGLLVAAAYASFFIAPEEKTMRVLQKIFYFHAATAWAGETAFGICFLANLAYVWLRKEKWDWLAVSAAETGIACITVVLITGPIWAKPAWGIYWTWDARLTSTFVLWLLYISYLLLRTMIEEPERRALLSALFGIFAFIDVPIVFGAIRWWRGQHPSPVIMGAGPDSGLEPTMKKVFLFSVLALHALMAFLISERYRLEKMRAEFEVLRREAEAV